MKGKLALDVKVEWIDDGDVDRGRPRVDADGDCHQGLTDSCREALDDIQQRHNFAEIGDL